MKKLFKAVAIITIFSIITRVLGFFFRIFLTRKLGAVGIGLFQMATSVLGIFMTLVSSGIPLTTAKLVSKYEVNADLKRRDKVVATALIIAMAVAVASSLIILLLRNVWNIVLSDSRAVEILIILIPSVIFSAVYAVFRGALWGQNDYFNCGLTELIEQILRFALTFFMINNVVDFFVATKYSAIAFNLTCLLSAIITIIVYFRRGKLNFARGEYKNIFKSSVPITGVRLANSFVQPLTTMIIPAMLIVSGYTTSEAIASFGVVMGMTFPMLFVPMTFIGSISMVLIPSITAMMTRGENEQIKSNIEQSINVAIYLSLIFVPLYISVGDLIGVVLYDNLMSGVMLQLSAICILPITLCNLTGSILNALNLEVKSFINYILGSLVLFAGLIILTPLIKINSISVSFFLSMTTITLLNMRKIKKTIPSLNLKIFSLLAKYLLIIIPSTLLGMFISNICKLIFTNFFSCVIGGGISIVCFVVLTSLFKVFELKSLFNIIRKKKLNKNL